MAGVSSMLVALAEEGLSGQAGNLDPGSAALAPPWKLRNLVRQLTAKRGANAAFAVAARLRALPFSPVLELLQTSHGVVTTARRWQRIERAWRVEAETKFQFGPKQLGLLFPPTVDHESLTRNLMIAGTLFHLLRSQRYGGLLISYRDAQQWRDLDVNDNGALASNPAVHSNEFHLTWTTEPASCSGHTEADGSTVGLTRRERIAAACRAMADTPRTLTDIALDLGFFDSAHFSKAFRRSAGMTPSLYRNTARLR